jgi:hypothetical protein
VNNAGTRISIDTLAVVALVAVGVGLPALIGAVSGSLTIPHNDDFNYRRVALGLYQSGDVQLTGWTVMSLIGQLVSVQPVLWISGGATWAFAATTALFGVVVTAASYGLARRVLSVPRSIFAVLGLTFFPGFLLNTTSFMTDVPALAGEIACLALGAIALTRPEPTRWRWLTASLVAGCFAFSIREFALAAPVSVLVVAAIADRSHVRRYALAGLGVVAACGAIYVITANLPGQGSATLLADAPFSFFSVQRVRRGAATLALVLSPALLVAAVNWRRWKLPDLGLGLLVGLVVYFGEITTIATTLTVPRLLVGNLLEPDGAPGGFGVLAGARPLLFTPPAWDILNLAALAAAVGGFGILGSVIGRAARRGDLRDGERIRAWLGSTAGLLALFAVLYGTGLVAFGLVASMFDRYLWPLAVPLGALLLLRSGAADASRTGAADAAVARRVGLGVAAFVMTVLAATSVALLLNSDAFDVARWRMGEFAVASGHARNTVDAGMEWVGYNARGTADVGVVPTPREMWYDAWWPSFRLCAIVSSSPLDIPGFRLEHADIQAYRLLLFGGPEEPLYLYGVAGPGCQ